VEATSQSKETVSFTIALLALL